MVTFGDVRAGRKFGASRLCRCNSECALEVSGFWKPTKLESGEVSKQVVGGCRYRPRDSAQGLGFAT